MTEALFDVTPPPPAPHILVVTESDGQLGDGYCYAIECPGVTDRCRAWAWCRCTRLGYFGELTTDDGRTVHPHEDEQPVVHGERHQWLESVEGWCVATSSCFLATDADLDDIAEPLGLGVGRYPVHVTFEEPGIVLELAG